MADCKTNRKLAKMVTVLAVVRTLKIIKLLSRFVLSYEIQMSSKPFDFRFAGAL